MGKFHLQVTFRGDYSGIKVSLKEATPWLESAK